MYERVCPMCVQDYPMLAGNLVALFFSAFLCIALTYMFPREDFEWTELKNSE